MVGGDVVLVDRLLHQAHAQDSSVEIKVGAGHPGDGRDMVKPAQWGAWRRPDHAGFKYRPKALYSVPVSVANGMASSCMVFGDLGEDAF